jgi:hypothetical protein
VHERADGARRDLEDAALNDRRVLQVELLPTARPPRERPPRARPHCGVRGPASGRAAARGAGASLEAAEEVAARGGGDGWPDLEQPVVRLAIGAGRARASAAGAAGAAGAAMGGGATPAFGAQRGELAPRLALGALARVGERGGDGRVAVRAEE